MNVDLALRSRFPWAVDASVAVPALVAGHSAHERCQEVVAERRPALAGPALTETFAVLTRLPQPDLLTPEQAKHLLDVSFPPRLRLRVPAAVQRELIDLLVDADISGPATNTALVGLAAKAAGATLITRDAQAVAIYEALRVDVELLLERTQALALT